MHKEYAGVITRFLRDEERLILSEEKEMPLVIEATDSKDTLFLQTFLASHSNQIMDDIAKYGAVLLRGFEIRSDDDFEKAVLSIQGMRGIGEALMSENGRIHAGKQKYVLHTNAVYKTGGTLYLGGFHSENYYSPDVPGYISFCCLKPSELGGETGIINMQKIYPFLDGKLKAKLEKNNFFVGKWLISEVVKRYQISQKRIEEICQYFALPTIGEGKDKFILMYKPNVFVHPKNKNKAAQINLFEIPTLNTELRKCFMQDYKGKTWFWHRLVWRLPNVVFKILEYIYVLFAAFFYSPRNSYNIVKFKLRTYFAAKKLPSIRKERVGTCFTDKDVKDLAKLMRKFYSSCLWQKGDILLVDNKQVMHAGMPGSGSRLIRAMICNPIAMKYASTDSGIIECRERSMDSIGHYVATNSMPVKNTKKQVEESIS